MEISITSIVGLGVTLLGIAWTRGARNDRVKFEKKLASMKLVEAEVTRHRREESYDPNSSLNTTTESFVAMVEYEVNKHRYTIPVRGDRKKGDKVTIAYNPAQPSDAMLAELTGKYAEITGMVMLAIGVVLFGLGLAGFAVLD